MKHNFARSATTVTAALALSFSLAACSSSSEPEVAEEAVEVEQVDDQTQESAAEDTAEEEAVEEDVADAEGEWTTLATISGNADQQSDTLVFSGGKIRVTYEFVDTSGMDMVVGAVYVLTEGTDLMTDGGIPDVMVSEEGAGETILRKSEGEYYVKVSSANAEYTVTVEEQK